MNIVEINPGTSGTLYIYATVALPLPLTILTIWILITGLQRTLATGKTALKRIGQPFYRIYITIGDGAE